jgi:hypothetical protein
MLVMGKPSIRQTRKPVRRGLVDGHCSPMPGMLAILPKVLLAAS